MDWENEAGLAAQKAQGRIDAAIAQQLEMGGKDLYRQARAIWRLAQIGRYPGPEQPYPTGRRHQDYPCWL